MTVLKFTAQASIRHGVSARATADIATSTLIDYGVIKKGDTEQVIDAKKIQRAKDKTMKEAQISDETKLQDDMVTAMLFDGRIDKTRVMLECESNGKLYPSVLRSVTTLSPVNLGGNMSTTLFLRMQLMRYQQLSRLH